MKIFSLKPILISVAICLAILVSASTWHSGDALPEKLQEHFLDDTASSLQFRFPPWKLTQGCNGGDLPFHFYLHPDAKDSRVMQNPGIATYKDFVIWASLDFPQELDLSKYESAEEIELGFKCIPVGVTITDVYFKESKKLEEKGLKYLQQRAENGQRYYQTILAGYYFYFDDTRKGLFWAERSAEQGETGGMKILGDAYTNGIGVIQDDVEGLKWYIIASTLGNLATQGNLLAMGPAHESAEKQLLWQQAHRAAKEWMNAHRAIFIGN